MGQGQAEITTRSDVRMRIDSGPGTSGRRLQDMAEAVTSKMGQVRQCYADIVEERPGVTGSMRIRVSLPRNPRGRVQLEVEDSVGDRQLKRCIERSLRRASFRGVDRPAIVFAQLEFTNSAAAAVERVAERREEAAQVRVSHNADGKPQASGGTANGLVRFTLTGQGRASDEAVAAAQRAVRAAIPGLLDCRRRASRREMNPEGALTVNLRIPRRGRAQARTTENTLEDQRAPICVGRALARAPYAAEAAGRVQVVVRFAGRRQLDVPTRD
jgi:hypothetical protein